MAWLHTWSGLLVSWLLFAIFLTGTVSYYRAEISQWMRPELRAMEIGAEKAASQAVARLEVVAPDARQWVIDLPTARTPETQMFFRRDPGNGPTFGRESLDPSTGLPAGSRETYGGDSLFYFHFDLLMPSVWGRLIVGFCAVTMLVAIVSGIVTHRRIFRDFFTFRPRRGQRSWLDAHNALGVMALPYHILIVYTGMVPLLYLYLPWGVDVAYPEGRAAYFQERGLSTPIPPATGRVAPLADLDAMVLKAEEYWKGGRPGRIVVDRPGDAAAHVMFFRERSETIGHRTQRLVFDGASGKLVTGDAPMGAAVRTGAFFYGLHVAVFAEQFLRGLLFFSGLLGTGVIATGLLLWSVKRRSRAEAAGFPIGAGHKLVDRLNVTAIVGLPVGIAAHFWANRLLPPGIAERAEWEVRALFFGWLLIAIWSACRPPVRAWIEGLWVCAALFGLLPLVNALTTDRHLGHAFEGGNGVFVVFDLAMLATGVLIACISYRLAKRWRDMASSAKPTKGV